MTQPKASRMIRKLGAAIAVILALSTGIACQSAIAKERQTPLTSVVVVKDWVHVKNNFAEPSERVVLIEGVPCIEAIFVGPSPSIGISCNSDLLRKLAP